MSEKIIVIYDAVSGEVVEREMTSEEINAVEKSSLAYKQEQELLKSAESKLAALGLTPEEIAAITGA